MSAKKVTIVLICCLLVVLGTAVCALLELYPRDVLVAEAEDTALPSFVIATADESRSQISDARAIRQTALAQLGVVYYTTISGAAAAVEGQKHAKDIEVRSLQLLHSFNK